jgi:hypothetical protein
VLINLVIGINLDILATKLEFQYISQAND